MTLAWNSSVNGAWKLGRDFVVVAETSSYIDLRLDIYIWTRYATFDDYNTFVLSGDWTFNGRVSFDVTTNSSWSTSNIAKIYSSTKRFYKQYGGSSASFTCSLTGIEYPNYNYKETVEGRYWVPALYYNSPAAPTGMTATRVADNDIRLTWSNTNPTSSTAPYGGLDVNNYVTIAGNQTGEYHIDRVFSIINSYTWRGGVPDRKYVFNVNAFNDDANPPDSAKTNSNVVYTTPASCANLRVTAARSNGSTLTLDLAWDYPSGNYSSVTNYKVRWLGGSSGEVNTANRTCSITGIVPGADYTISVVAQNPGDGRGTTLTGGSSSLYYPAPNVAVDMPQVSVVSGPSITGTVEPRTSSVTISFFNPYQAGNQFAIKVDNVVTQVTGNSYTISGLKPGNHLIQVASVNWVGIGAYSDAISITAPGLPGPPSIRKFAPVADGLSVSLGPGYENGSAISSYQYRITRTDGSEVVPWSNAPGMSFVVTNVQSGVVYILQVRSVNGVGTGTNVETLSSDAAGGRVGYWDGTKMVYGFVKNPNGTNAVVRVFDGVNWNLTAR